MRPLLVAMAAVSALLMVALGTSLKTPILVVGLILPVALFGLLLWKGAPLKLLIGTALVPFLYAGTSAALSGHDPGASVAYFVAGVVLAMVLASARLAMGCALIGTVVLGLETWALWRGEPLLPKAATLSPTEVMASNAGIFAVMSTLVILSLSFLMGRLRYTLSERLEALENLKRESLERAETLAKLQQAHSQLLETQAQLVKAGKIELLGQLAGGIAHDMNNALTIILTEAEIISHSTSTETSSIVEAVKHASALTRQLLLMGRRDVIQPRPIDLGVEIEHILPMLRRVIPSDIEIQTSLSAGVVVHADPNQIQQIVLNLSTNAAHAMPKGGRLSLKVSATMTQAQFEIADTGHGMDEETRARIFEPFFTTKPQGIGTGLGLSSVRTITEMLNGQIACASAPNQGTRFTITLPLLAPNALAPTPSSASANAPPRLNHRRILVADDDVNIRAAVCITLQTAGAFIVDAGNAEAAITLAQNEQKPFDLLWTDVVMPHGGGGALIQWFSEHSPQTKILICTGYSDDEALRREVELGRYHFLRKPFSRAEALAACAQCLTQPPA